MFFACVQRSRCLRCCPRPCGRYVVTDERPYRHHTKHTLTYAAAVQLYGCATPLSGGVAQPQSSHIRDFSQLALSQPRAVSKCCGFVW